MKTLILLLLFCSAAAAQTPTFETASIRLNQSEGATSSIRASSGLVTIENASLRKIILAAYGIPEDRQYSVAGPDWLATERFDIQARFPAETSVPQMRQMLQTLLAERFKMALHSETRQEPTYALVLAKDGPKVSQVEAGQPSTSSRAGHLEARKIPMQKLADLLGVLLDRPVNDATGLAGVFDFTLEWSPTGPDGAVADATVGPSIFTALQEQLGLRLESRKSPVPVLVIDHMEKAPTEN